MRRVWLTLGGLTVFLAFFFGTLLALDYLDPAATRNRTRAEHAKLLADALQKSLGTRVALIPRAREASFDGIKKDLVDGGFLSALPERTKGSAV